MGESLIEVREINRFAENKRLLRLRFLSTLEDLNIPNPLFYCSKAIEIISKNNDLRNYDKYKIRITKNISNYNKYKKWVLTSHIQNGHIKNYKYIKGLRGSFAILLIKTSNEEM